MLWITAHHCDKGEDYQPSRQQHFPGRQPEFGLWEITSMIRKGEDWKRMTSIKFHGEKIDDPDERQLGKSYELARHPYA